MRWFKKSYKMDYISNVELETYPTYPFVKDVSPVGPWIQPVSKEPWGGFFEKLPEGHENVRRDPINYETVSPSRIHPNKTVMRPWTEQVKPDYSGKIEPDSFVHSENPINVYRTRSKSSIYSYNNRLKRRGKTMDWLIRESQTAIELAESFISARDTGTPEERKMSYTRQEIVDFITEEAGRAPDDAFIDAVIELVRRQRPEVTIAGEINFWRSKAQEEKEEKEEDKKEDKKEEKEEEVKKVPVKKKKEEFEVTPEIEEVIHRIITEVSSKIPEISKVDILDIVRAYHFELGTEDFIFSEVMKFFTDKRIDIPETEKEIKE